MFTRDSIPSGEGQMASTTAWQMTCAPLVCLQPWKVLRKLPTALVFTPVQSVQRHWLQNGCDTLHSVEEVAIPTYAVRK